MAQLDKLNGFWDFEGGSYQQQTAAAAAGNNEPAPPAQGVASKLWDSLPAWSKLALAGGGLLWLVSRSR